MRQFLSDLGNNLRFVKNGAVPFQIVPFHFELGLAPLLVRCQEDMQGSLGLKIVRPFHMEERFFRVRQLTSEHVPPVVQT